MSERKTAEIKFRVAPSAKARWQEAAAREDISLSQLIDNAVQNYLWAKENQRRDGGLLDFIATNCQATGELTAEMLETAQRQVLGKPVPVESLLDGDEPKDEYLTEFCTVTVPEASDTVVLTNLSEACGCRPWEFCRHKAKA